ncbi:MAG TPA: cardiolipin synthase [Hyphomicrobiales bacterium]|nr:cardiolipin synthase [Hyphomicrobiales bacterium]
MLLTILTLSHLALFSAVTLRVLARPQLNTSTRTAWVFLLLALPFLGAVAYLLIGEIYFGKGERAKASRVMHRVGDHVVASGEPRNAKKWGQASAFAASINGFGVCGGNRSELLDSPAGARQRMLDDMDAARESINVLYYIWLDDDTGRAVAEALIRAAGRGVRCRAMVDALGSRRFIASATWRKLQQAGIHTVVALPIDKPWQVMFQRRLDLRNHRKITVIDGRICHCGSQNCADAAFLPKRRFAPWVDIMVRLEGPVALQMNLLFAQDWLRYRDEDVTHFTREPPVFEDGFGAQVVGTGPMVNRNVTAQLFSRLIFAAREELIITTPYFVPGEVVCAALLGAAFSGVKVTLIVPHRNDSGFVGHASRSYYPLLTRAGVTIAEYQGGLLHAKILTVDGRMTFMGSSNLDIRSFDLNFENDVLLHDPQLSAAIRARQLAYVAQSVLIDPKEVRRWPVYKRIWLNAFAALGPLL